MDTPSENVFISGHMQKKEYKNALREASANYMYSAFRKAFHGIKHFSNFLFVKNNGKKYKKIVFLYGFYGMNLGDDLFFETIINRYPDVLFFVLLNTEYHEFFKQFDNVKFYSYESKLVRSINNFGNKLKIRDLFEHLLLLKCRTVVHIGGSIYQQVDFYIEDYNLRKRRFGIGKRYFSISSNFGPFHSEDFYDIWRKMFKKSYDICFRDKYSFELFKNVKSVRYAPDLLFSFKSKPVDVEASAVSISLIDPRYEYRVFPDDVANAYKKSIVNTVTELIKSGRTVNLLGFCKFQGDDKFIEQILDELPDKIRKSVNVLNYDFNSKNEIIEKLASSEYIVGTRLHSTILGLAMGKKVLPIVYDRKISNILEDINYSGKTVSMNDMPLYQDSGLVGLLDKAEIFDISDISDSENLQFKELDKFLKRK